MPAGSHHEPDARALADLLARMQVSVDALLVGDADVAQRRPTRLGELVHQVVRAHDPDGSHVEVHVPALVMNVDPVKLERIIDNLLSNALAHAPDGTPVAATASFTARRVTLLVTDDGPGIPEPIVDRLEQGGSSPQVPGGLDVVARFARAHGGQVRVHGPGARVVVELRTPTPSSRERDVGPGRRRRPARANDPARWGRRERTLAEDPKAELSR